MKYIDVKAASIGSVEDEATLNARIRAEYSGANGLTDKEASAIRKRITLAIILHNAHNPLPLWEDLSSHQQKRWIAVADKALEVFNFGNPFKEI
jgi:hypothetical protein